MKQILKLLILFLIVPLFLISGCEKKEYDNQIRQDNPEEWMLKI